MKAEVVKVTPDMANRFLSKNKKNRNISERKLNEYIGQMNNNQWQFNGDTIRFNKDGDLIDGQHRLTAIVRSGKSQEFLLISGLDNSVSTTIDTGKQRNAGDTLKMRGFSNASGIASLTSKILSWDSGRNPDFTSSHKTGGSAGNGFTKPSIDDILNFATKNDLNDFVIKGSLFGKKFNGLTSGEYAFLYYLFAKKDQDDADEFFHLFTTGLSSNPRNPVIHVRNKIISSMGSNLVFTGRVKFISIIKAWNLFRQREECTRIRVSIDEDVPAII